MIQHIDQCSLDQLVQRHHSTRQGGGSLSPYSSAVTALGIQRSVLGPLLPEGYCQIRGSPKNSNKNDHRAGGTSFQGKMLNGVKYVKFG